MAAPYDHSHQVKVQIIICGTEGCYTIHELIELPLLRGRECVSMLINDLMVCLMSFTQNVRWVLAEGCVSELWRHDPALQI